MSEAARETVAVLVAVIAVGGGGLALPVTQSRLIDALRERHPALWRAMGSPSLASDISSSEAYLQSREGHRNMLSFVLSGYRALNDPVVTRRVWQVRITWAYWAVLLLSFALLITTYKARQ
jgi:hypothetical protein